MKERILTKHEIMRKENIDSCAISALNKCLFKAYIDVLRDIEMEIYPNENYRNLASAINDFIIYIYNSKNINTAYISYKDLPLHPPVEKPKSSEEAKLDYHISLIKGIIPVDKNNDENLEEIRDVVLGILNKLKNLILWG